MVQALVSRLDGFDERAQRIHRSLLADFVDEQYGLFTHTLELLLHRRSSRSAVLQYLARGITLGFHSGQQVLDRGGVYGLRGNGSHDVLHT
jgi:hypothetical protein